MHKRARIIQFSTLDRQMPDRRTAVDLIFIKFEDGTQKKAPLDDEPIREWKYMVTLQVIYISMEFF